MSEQKLPTCVGIIMDGNRRWSRAKNKPTLEGHRRGAETLKTIARAGWEQGIQHVIFYAFSTENWKRSKQEVSYLMNLLEENVRELTDLKEDVRVRCIGAIDSFSDRLQKLIRETEERTKERTGGTLVLALSYGGRTELLQAMNTLIANNTRTVSEEDFSRALYTHDIPDPDMIIRTGGEKRLSNFLPWQSVYSELFFTDTYWPDFSKEELFGMLEEYAERERRHGK